MKRHVFFISDSTGITAETMGNSLISQFEDIRFTTHTLPYMDTEEKAENAIEQINQACRKHKEPAIVFATLVDQKIQNIVAKCQGHVIDLFKSFIAPLETALSAKSSYTIGKSHGLSSRDTYKTRIDAVSYALNNDDGIGTHNYEHADVIVVGVSRCGKTPTCLYLALHFGTYAANFPFADEDLDNFHLAECLAPFRDKLFGLTVDPLRLHSIRKERAPNSNYASLEQCTKEIEAINTLFKREKIPFLDTTTYSVEEISTRILANFDIKRKLV